ncbi:hypothetical protein [Prevotella sp. P6B4]|uniref:hypothetical protein n=1 Tax=Prevotella sp. P6B4 TaxID=1410614 RepID=UPI00048AE69D|nr:hypothetical protein [Prevotella sp. P6B4]
MIKLDFLKFAWRYILAIIVVIVLIRILVYPERTKINEYRERLSISHSVTKASINSITHRKTKIFYEFMVNGVKYSGISRYTLLNPPYPQKGDSIDVYYSEDDPNVNLWSGEFTE